VHPPLRCCYLGVLDLATFGYALRMRWEWLARTDPGRMWAGIPSKPERIVRAMLDTSVTVAIGNGSRTLFLEDRWLDGTSIALPRFAANPSSSKESAQVQTDVRSVGRRAVDFCYLGFPLRSGAETVR
jgi:hypothetical protein